MQVVPAATAFGCSGRRPFDPVALPITPKKWAPTQDLVKIPQAVVGTTDHKWHGKDSLATALGETRALSARERLDLGSRELCAHALPASRASSLWLTSRLAVVPQLAEEERHGRAGAVGLLGRVVVRPAGGGGVHARLEGVRLDVDEHNERLMRCKCGPPPLCRLLANVHRRTGRRGLVLTT